MARFDLWRRAKKTARALSAVTLTAIALLVTASNALAACEDELQIVGPTILVNIFPFQCVRVSNQVIVGDIDIQTTIGPIDDDAFAVEASTITGSLVNNGTIIATNGRYGMLLGNDAILNGYLANNGAIFGGIRNEGQIVGGVVTTATLEGGFWNTGSISGVDFTVIGLSSSTSGGFHNEGTITGGLYTIIIDGSISGGIENSGQIQGTGGGIVTGGFVLPVITGGIQNTGTIAGGRLGIGMHGFFSGGIGNGASGTIQGTGLVIDGIDNVGIHIYLGPFGEVPDFSGGIQNAGTIFGDAFGIQSDGAFSGGIANSGTISGGSSAIVLNGTFSDGITNLATGLISSSNGDAIRVSGAFSGGIENAGSITGDVNGIQMQSADFSGGIHNASTGSIFGGSGSGINLDALTAFEGSITNDGSISGGIAAILNLSTNFSGGIQNTGSISGGFWGLINNGTLEDGITNSGTIFGSNAGILSGGSISGGINNSGSITSNAFGIRTGNAAATLAGGIVNTSTGTISGTINAISLEGITTGDIANAGHITSANVAINILGTVEGDLINSGLIQGIDSSIRTSNSATLNGGITNTSAGEIYGVTGSAIDLQGITTGGINNGGWIHGGAVAISLSGTFSGGLTNSGTIAGISTAIEMGGGFTGDLTNSSLILGTTNGINMTADWDGRLLNNVGGIIGGTNLAGIWFQNFMRGGLENHGFIGGGIYAIRNDGFFDNGILNSGTINGGTYGIAATQGVFTGGITNQAGGIIRGVNFLGITVGQDFSGGIHNAGEITGATYGIFVNDLFDGGIHNTGAINGAGGSAIVLANTAVFEGGITNSFFISGGTGIENRGVLNGGIQNSGQILGTAAYGIFMTGGSTLADGIENSGTISGALTGIILDNVFSGGVINTATGNIIGNQGFGLLSLGQFEGGIDNAGHIVGLGVLAEPQGSDPFNSVDGGIAVLITGPTFNSGVWDGTFLNRATGVIDGTYFGVKMMGASFNGEFVNQGQIVGGDPLDLTGFGYSFGASLSYTNWEGDIVNEATGSIVASSSNAGVPSYNFPNAGLAIGLFDPIDSVVAVSNVQGNVINDGLIAGPTGIVMFLNVFEGSILNGAGALIEGVNGHGILMTMASWTGSLENAGQIRSANASGVELFLDGNGVDIVNTALGRIEGQLFGIRATGGAVFNGSIDNAGWIAATGAPDTNLSCSAHCGVLINALTVDVDVVNRAGAAIFGANYGLFISGDSLTGSILNQGTMQGTDFAGLLLAANGTGTIDVDVENSGSIIGGRWGLNVGSFGAWTGNLNNSGTITATGADAVAAVGVGNLIWTGQLINSGTIQNLRTDGGAGLRIEPVLSTLTELDIVNSGTISGFDGVRLQWFGPWDGSLTNSGSIIGTRYALQIERDGGDGVFNSGAILGSVHVSFMNTDMTYQQTGNGAITGTPTSTFSLSNTNVTTLDFRGGYLYGDVLGGADLNDLFQVNAGANGRFEYVSGVASNLASFAVNSGTAVLGDTEITTNALSVAANATLHMSNNAVINAQNVSFAPNATFAAELTTNTAVHPTINVSGTAALGGAFVAHIDPMAFSGSGETEWVYDGIISGPVTGTFSSVTIFGAPNFFTITPSYNSLDITISLTSFSELIEPTNPNQVSVGDALEEIYEDGTTDPDLINLFDTLSTASDDEIAEILDDIAGSMQAETGMAALKADDPWKQSVGQRVNAARSTGCTVAGDTWCLRRYAQAPSPVVSDAADDAEAFGWLETGLRDVGATSMWGRIVGVWGKTDGGASSPGSHQRTYGLVGGVDHVVDQTLLLGLAGQYVNTQADFESSFNRSSIESVQIGPYFSYGGAEAYVNGNASVIASRALTDRFFAVGDQIYVASVRFPSTTYTASLEGGTIFEVDGYRLEPNIGINYALQMTDTYAEGGAGGLGLIVSPEDLNSLRSLVGGRISRVYDVGDRKMVPELRLEWRHEFLDRRHTFEAAFAGAPDVTFLVNCSPSARDVFALGGSVTIPVSGRVTGFIDAEGAASEDSMAGTLSVGARATW